MARRRDDSGSLVLLVVAGLLIWGVLAGGLSTAITVVAALAIPTFAIWLGFRWRGSVVRKRIRREIEEIKSSLLTVVQSAFITKSCSRCHESDMRLLSVSPNARSIEYQCINCNKKMRASASSPDAPNAKLAHERLLATITSYPSKFHYELNLKLIFSAPEDLLPYEYPGREPIPESMRTEVWRRDNGCCVTCGSRVKLEFDHIIPVSRGGATTARNLQLLCQQCNRSKGARI